MDAGGGAASLLPAGEEPPEAAAAAAAGDGSRSTRFSFSFQPLPILSAGPGPALKRRAAAAPSTALCRGGAGNTLRIPQDGHRSVGMDRQFGNRIPSRPPFPTWGLVPIPRTPLAAPQVLGGLCAPAGTPRPPSGTRKTQPYEMEAGQVGSRALAPQREDRGDPPGSEAGTGGENNAGRRGGML